MLIAFTSIQYNYEYNHVRGMFSARYVLELFRDEGLTTKPQIQILLWTSMKSRTMIGKEEKDVMLGDCGECSCKFTYEKGTLTNGSHAVVFNLRAAGSFIKGKANLPYYHPPGQYWVLYNHEATILEDEIYDMFPGDVFNLTATYRQDADIYLPYGRCEPRKQGKYVLPPNFLKKKTGLAVWHVSHCTDRSLRMTFTKQLQKYIKVDVFGKCSGNQLPNDHFVHIGQNLTDVATDNINKYKFYLSFENTYCREYITEKAYKMFQDNVYTVPIVRGSGPYKGMLPPGSYINADDFNGAKELAEYLTKLDQNDHLYMEYFKSRTDYECSTDSYNNTHWLCGLCNGVSRALTQQIQKTYNQNEIHSIIHPRENCVLYDENKKMRPNNIIKL